MPWVRLDDRFPSHRKVALLSDRAFRLHVSALCWSSENLTEGKILDRELTVIARVRNTKATAKELEDANLWDRVDDGWEIHDFLEYNPDRARVKADRENNAARQKTFRERKRAEKEAKQAAAQAASEARRNGVTPPSRNGGSNGTPVPSPSPEVPPTEVPTDCEPVAPPLPMIGDRPRIPAASKPLVEAITSAGMVVGWDLTAGEWLLIEALLKRCGITALLNDAAGSWQGARSKPRSGKYFLPAWRKLPDIPDHVRNLPAVVNGTGPTAPVSRQQRETNDLFDRALNRAQARMQESS